jgi:hypothetical protein
MPDTKRQLKELDRLRVGGIITEEEYVARRQAIIADVSTRPGGGVGSIFKWGAVGCLSIVGGLVALVVLIVVVIAIAAGGGGGSDDDVRVSLAEGSSGTVETALGVKNKVTIDAITDPAVSTNQFEQPQAGYHYVTFALTIENVGERETTGVDVILRATDGTEYEQTFATGVGATDLNTLQSLTSGGKTTAVVAFEVRDGTEFEWLKFDPNPFAKGDLYFEK